MAELERRFHGHASKAQPPATPAGEGAAPAGEGEAPAEPRVATTP